MRQCSESLLFEFQPQDEYGYQKPAISIAMSLCCISSRSQSQTILIILFLNDLHLNDGLQIMLLVHLFINNSYNFVFATHDVTLHLNDGIQTIVLVHLLANR